jgi:penicillin-binding protein 1A
MGKRFGIYDDLPLIHSVVLGSQEVDLLTITNAYSSFVNGGKKVTSSLIERIDDRHGRTIYRRDRRNCNWCDLLGYDIPEGHPLPPPLQTDNRKQLIDPRLAYQMTSILEGVVQRGSAIRARWQVDKPVAGKTGTTNETRDAWFIGYSPNLVVGVYTGFDTPRTLGEKETGSSVALPAFITFMQNTLKNEPSIPFRTPPGIQLVKIDRFSGLPPSGYGEEEIIQEAFVTGEELFIPDDAKAMVEDLPPVITDAYSFVNSDPYNLNPSYQQSLTPEDRFFKQIIPSAPSVVSPPTYESPTPGDWPSPSAGQSPQPEPKKRTPLTGTGGIY